MSILVFVISQICRTCSCLPLRHHCIPAIDIGDADGVTGFRHSVWLGYSFVHRCLTPNSPAKDSGTLVRKCFPCEFDIPGVRTRRTRCHRPRSSKCSLCSTRTCTRSSKTVRLEDDHLDAGDCRSASPLHGCRSQMAVVS